jgi:hypothetical protein
LSRMKTQAFFKLELKRLVSKRNIFIFFTVFLITAIFILFGISRYKALLESKTVFQNTEKVKVGQYKIYPQYGGFGIRLLSVHPPISALFSHSADSLLLANVNTAEALKIFNPRKGKYALDSDSGYYMTFCGVIYLLGIIIALSYGFFVKKGLLKYQANFTGCMKGFLLFVISKITVIVSVYFLLSTLSALIFLLSGLKVELLIMMLWFTVGCFVLIFFFLIGFCLSFLKNKTIGILFLGIAYFFSVVALPGIFFKYNQFNVTQLDEYFDFELANIRIYQQAEKRMIEHFGSYRKLADSEIDLFKRKMKEAVDKEFNEIFDREREMLSKLRHVFERNNVLSVVCPSTFFLSLNKEISGTGYENYLDFYSFALGKKKEFLDFYTERSILTQSKPSKIESFIKGDENIFQAQPRLPHAFWLGVVLTLFYSALLLFFSYHKFSRMTTEDSPEGSTAAGVELPEDSKLNFVLCNNPGVKAEIMQHYQIVKNAVLLEKVKPDDFKFFGLKPVDLFRHLADVAGVSREKAGENLRKLGIADLNHFELTDDVILKIYAAILTSQESDYIVIDDFIKSASKEFEANFYKLIDYLHSTKNKNILYLSCEMYETREPINEIFRVSRAKALPIDNIYELSLR